MELPRGDDHAHPTWDGVEATDDVKGARAEVDEGCSWQIGGECG